MPNLLDTLRQLRAAAKYELEGHSNYAGMPISIENKKGSVRSGVGTDGKPWSVRMAYDYGFIDGTVGQDGDEVDCFIGPIKNAKFAYVIHQKKSETDGRYDEDKVMLGFATATAAKRAYHASYDGQNLFQSMSMIPMARFIKKVMKTNNKIGNKKIKAQYDGDYYQYTEKAGLQPISTSHPPSLKNPIPVPSDNPGDLEDKYGDRKKRRSQKTLAMLKELMRRQTGKPEFAETTLPPARYE